MDIISNMDFYYRYKDTRFHNLNPLAKFLVCVVIIILALVLEDPLILIVLLSLTVLIAAEAKVMHGWFFYIKVALWIVALLIPLNMLISPDGPGLVSFLFGLIMSLRLFVVISSFALLSLTLSPSEVLRLMKKFRLPTKSIYLTSLTTRFVPALLEDVETLTQVQKTRGAKLKGIRGKGPIIIPLLSNSLERSVSVAEAMEARGIDLNKRP